MYIDELVGIVNKYKNTHHSIIKMKPVDVLTKILNSKLMILLEYQNIKTFLQRAMFQIGLRKFLLLKKLKILFCRHMY